MNVDDPRLVPGSTAQHATADATTGLHPVAQPSSRPTGPTLHATPSSGVNGSTTGSNEPVGETPTSKTSDEPSKPSNKHWRLPKDARAFAAQANEVATMILNGDIDREAARQYIGVARAMAQVLSTEVYRARFLREAPNLSLEEES